MNPFIFNAQFPRVIFGAGSLQHLERELDLLGANLSTMISTTALCRLLLL